MIPAPSDSCPTAQPTARNVRRKDARPGELLQAALDLFVEKGFAATRAEEVAQRAGVSKGTLFIYFSSKEELFKAVVRENISGRFSQWNAELDAFEGSTADMLRQCYRLWWERQGQTKVSGITKLMLSEGKNFPELAAFYQHEVMHPAHRLIRRILERGIQRGEFVAVDLKYTVYAILAPMIFLQLLMHSATVCCDLDDPLQVNPGEYLESQLQVILNGLMVPRPPVTTSKGHQTP